MRIKIGKTLLTLFIICGIFNNLLHSDNEKTKNIRKEYYKSGKLRIISTYINGKIEGEKRIFYENGDLAEEIQYKNGLMDGIRIIYFPFKEIAKITHYKEKSKKFQYL